MRNRFLLGRFARESTGAVSAFLVVLLPVLIALGGVAVDISQINAQKRDTQAAADLAALSAATLLPDRDAASARVYGMLAELRPCAQRADCAQAPAPKITFLVRDNLGRLKESTDPAQSAVALRVENIRPYEPILLGFLYPDETLAISRSATAERSGTMRGFVGFTLRNQLLSLNTRNSILDHLLSPLGVALTTDVLGSNGLANARVKLDRLLALASAGTAVELLTFNDVLQVPIALSEILGVALNDPLGKPYKGYATRTPAPDKKVKLGEILAMSPTLLDLKMGDVLPDVEIGALDLLKVLANLASSENERLGLGIDLTLIDRRLGGAQIGLGLIRSHATGYAAPGDLPAPHAKLHQTDLNVTVGLLSLVRLDLILGIAGVEAELVALNCQAREGTDDILASFNVRTYPLSTFLSLQLLNKDASLDAKLDPEKSSARLLAPAEPVRVDFTREDFDEGRLTRDVRGKISVAHLGPQLQTLLQNIEIGPSAGGGGKCGWNILGCIIDALTGLTAKLVGLVLDIVNVVIPLDIVVNKLLETLGIDIAGATITLDHVLCDGENVGPARLSG